MAQINKPNEYFNPVLYTGNESTNAITTGLANDFVWVKAKDSAGVNHYLFDSVRGVQKNLHSNTTDAEATEANTLTAFNSTGFTLGSDAQVNGSGQPHISWNWKAGGTAVSNTDGSISSTVSANTTAGFSIVSYTGTGSSATVGHGLGVKPKIVIIKNRSSATNWSVYSQALVDSTGNNSSTLVLNSDASDGLDGSYFNSTQPTSTVFTVGSNSGVSGSGNNLIAYCFAEKKGFSKFGSYTGNGNADGSFIYTGFKPAFIMAKRSSATGDWVITDVKRNTYNPLSKRLFPNQSIAESTTNNWYDVLSNGFKARLSDGTHNGSGSTYIYMAFAENPLVGTNNIPATAR